VPRGTSTTMVSTQRGQLTIKFSIVRLNFLRGFFFSVAKEGGVTGLVDVVARSVDPWLPMQINFIH